MDIWKRHLSSPIPIYSFTRADHMRPGSHMTDEQRARCSAVLIGNTRGLGLKASPETRARMSVASKGKPKSDAARANMGHPQSPETRVKISASRIGPLHWHWQGGKQISERKHAAKRRTFGFTPLNSWFPGCDGHHINKSDVIYLPRKLHRSIAHNQWTGKGMAAMNALAGAFLTEDWT